MGRRSLRELVPPWAAQNWRQARDSCVPVLYRRAFHLRPEGARFSQPRATPSFMHTSRKPQCFNELQNRTNWSCSDRTFTISPIFRANGYLLKRPFKSRPRCVHQRGQRPGERWTLSLPNKNRPNGPTVLDRTWDRLARWADRTLKEFPFPRALPSFMHTSRKPQCFNELQNRTNWSCSDRTFTISPIFRAKRIPAETALQVKTEMCASTRALPWAGRTEGLRPSNARRFKEQI